MFDFASIDIDAAAIIDLIPSFLLIASVTLAIVALGRELRSIYGKTDEPDSDEAQ